MKIFIAGGTSGIGQTIALRYLKAGHTVGICGRDIGKVVLDKDYPLLKMYQLDVYNKEALQNAVNDFTDDQIDIFIISAGNYSDSLLRELSYSESTDMLKVNIVGALNALESVRDIMYHQGKGHIVVIASSSGLLDYPQATIYGKSKRALITIADAYRSALAAFDVNITIVAPGYVDTPKLRELNNGDLSRKPFVVDCEYAATTIIKAIEEKKEFVIFPPKMKYMIHFLSCLPSAWLNFIMQRKSRWPQKK